ncbi:MAG: hypothetical protein JXB30_08620 [Anaerolineae bacterium]|nr:hypothetical protein [Anaerolineae bacterium]
MAPKRCLQGCMGLIRIMPRAHQIVLVVLLIGLAYMCLPISWVRNVIAYAQIWAELPEVKARWKAQAVSDYEVAVSVMHPQCLSYDAVLDVRGGKAYTVTVTRYPFPGSEGETEVVTPGSKAEECLRKCGYKLIPEMFDEVEHAVKEYDPRFTYLRVSFDPEYGFVTSYDQDCFFSSRMSGCGSHYSYHDFQPRD